MEIRTPRDIGREAAACRRFLRLKRGDLARACGVSRQWICALERGKAPRHAGALFGSREAHRSRISASLRPG